MMMFILLIILKGVDDQNDDDHIDYDVLLFERHKTGWTHLEDIKIVFVGECKYGLVLLIKKQNYFDTKKGGVNHSRNAPFFVKILSR